MGQEYSKLQSETNDKFSRIKLTWFFSKEGLTSYFLGFFSLILPDLIEVFDTRNVLPEKTADLKTIINALQKKYCGTIGFECDYIENDVESNWLQNYIENKID